MNEPIERYTFAGYTIEILQDCDPLNPRTDEDHLGDMYYRGTARYCFGEHPVSENDLRDMAERKDCVRLPVYALVHGSETVSTKPFGDVWDSGQSGWIIAEPKKIKEFLGYDFPLTEEQRAHVVRLLESEVETYAQYLQGDVYGFRVLDGEDELDSCWGFYGVDDCHAAAKEAAAARNADSKPDGVIYSFIFLEDTGSITTQAVEACSLMDARLLLPGRFTDTEILAVVRNDNGEAMAVLGGTNETVLTLEEGAK